MGKGHFPDRGLSEISDTKSGAKMDEHEEFIQKFLDKGYEIVSQETTKEKGLDQEIISETLTTILKSANIDLPLVKFEAKEVYGKYNYEKAQFEPFESAKFALKAYTKNARIENRNDPWKAWDIS